MTLLITYHIKQSTKSWMPWKYLSLISSLTSWVRTSRDLSRSPNTLKNIWQYERLCRTETSISMSVNYNKKQQKLSPNNVSHTCRVLPRHSVGGESEATGNTQAGYTQRLHSPGTSANLETSFLHITWWWLCPLPGRHKWAETYKEIITQIFMTIYYN